MDHPATPRAAPPGRTGWRWRNVPVPQVHLGVLAASLAVHAAWPRRLPGGPGWRRAGWPALAAGTGLVAWATRSAGTVALATPDELVTTGAYAVSRHPMYVGWGLIYAGVTLVVNSVWPVAALPVVAGLATRVARGEEARLERAFPEAYPVYRQATPRWL